MSIATASEPDETDRTDTWPSSEHIDAAFLELTHDLESYVEDLLWHPTFHGFLYLPIELRLKIYEEYFLEDKQSLTTQEWPLLDWSRVVFASELSLRNSALFLPRLCFASKTFLKEAAPFLLGSLYLECQSPLTALHFIERAAHFRVLELDVAYSIRKLKISDVNNIGMMATLHAHGRKGQQIDVSTSGNTAASVVLNCCKGLRLLNVGFHAPVQLKFDHLPSSDPPEINAQSIGQYFHGFNVVNSGSQQPTNTCNSWCIRTAEHV